MHGCDAATASTGSYADDDAFESLAEQSGTFRAPTARTLSDEFWNLDLTRGLPRVISRDGVSIAAGDITRIRHFLKTVFPSLTEEGLGAAPLEPNVADTKRWYLGERSDLLELRKEDETIGVMIGAPEDWSTYYLRIYAVAPSHQRPIVTRRFAECVLKKLAACGVQRVVTDTSPANASAALRLSELQFHVTGQQLSERYGPLIRYTKFLDPAAESAFLSRFAGSAPPRANRARTHRKGGTAMKKRFALATS
jgi:hypothetical protein